MSRPEGVRGETDDGDVVDEACGAYGERVEDPAEIGSALKRGLARVRDGQTAVLNVIVE